MNRSMTSRCILLSVLVGCENFAPADPPSPEFLDTEASCTDGQMSFTALLRSELDVSNLVLERTDIDDESLEPVFPVVSAETFGGELTDWTAVIDHDCDESIAVTWTATTLLETQVTAQTAWPDVSLTAGDVDPPYGSTIGGSTIEIRGTDMLDVDRVWFDGEPAEIVGNEAESVTVLTPEGAQGTVDVRYAAGVTEQDLPEAFTYWPDQSDQVVGLARLGTDLYDPSYFTIRSAYVDASDFISGNYVQYELLFHEALDPSQAFHAQFYAPVGGCEAGMLTWTETNVGVYLSLHEDSMGELALLPTTDDLYYYVEQQIDSEDWRAISFDLEIPDATETMPSMLLEDALTTTDLPSAKNWDHTTPMAFSSGDDLVLSWSGASLDKFNISLYPVYHDSRGLQVLGSSTCTWDASSSPVTVPWEDVMGDYASGGATGFMARLGVMREQETVLPHDNSILQSVSITNYWLYYVF